MIVRPHYMDILNNYRNVKLVKILAGIRRCGKSTILEMLQDDLQKSGVAGDHIISMCYTSEDFDSNMTDKDMYRAIKDRITDSECYYLLLDEVQEIAGWEKAVNSLLENSNTDIYITGSNSKLMSSEISTYLTGRYISIPVFTLSFTEYQVGEFNLTSDLFDGKVFEDREACQELCRILLKDNKIVIKNVKTKYAIRSLENHSVELDIIAEDTDGNIISVEIQMYEEKSPFRRMRYYLAGIDMSILEKGKPYRELPDVTLVFITKEDFIGDKRGHYGFPRKADGQDVTMSLDNGLHEICFNLEYYTEDVGINELLEYFKDSDPHYQTNNFPRIVERVNFFKIQKEGVNIMCEIADRIRKEGRQEGIREGIIKSLK